MLDSNQLVDRIDEPVRFGPPITKPEKVICIGLNYRDHATETSALIPEEPIVFMKAPNCVIGPNDQILVPKGSSKTDWEVELGVVIGGRARYLETPDDARAVIAGYCISSGTRESVVRLSTRWVRGWSPLTRLLIHRT